MVKRLGGKVTTSASGRTSLLITGSVLENGLAPTEGRKYKTVIERNQGKQAKGVDPSQLCKILTEKDFIAAYEPLLPESRPQNEISATGASSEKKAAGLAGDLFTPGAVKQVPNDIVCPLVQEEDMWVDKYKPKELDHLIGNAAATRHLEAWLKDWHRVHTTKEKKVPFTKQNPGAKCALISGSPGIGKTTAAHLIATRLGFEVFETNASDARSKKSVDRYLQESVSNTTILLSNMCLQSKKKTSAERLGAKKVIIMDEVDGMSSEDRGGMQQLIKVIKTTKTPIICICNDRMKSSVRSLANHCFDLRFHKPNKNTVLKRLMQICQAEGLSIEPNALEVLIQSGSGDIRQLFNLLQVMKLNQRQMRQQGRITFDWAKSETWRTKKDSVLSIDHSQATQFIFNHSQEADKFKLRFDAFFVNYDLIPLLVAENYPAAVRNYGRSQLRVANSNVDTLKQLEMLSDASEAVCDADCVSQLVMREQQWKLLPLSAALNVRIATLSQGKIGFAGFPEWLGQNSSARRKKRLLDELSLHMKQFTGGLAGSSIRMDMVHTLKNEIIRPLNRAGKDGVHETLDFMDSYGLSRDDVFESLQEMHLGKDGSNMYFDKLDSRIKREFTRLYNMRSHKSQLLVRDDAIVGLKRPSKKKKAMEHKNTTSDDGIEGSDNNAAENDSDEDLKDFISQKQQKKRKSQSNAKQGKRSRKKTK